jgi:hypothetical protein
MYGKKAVVDMSADANTTPFTGKEESADEAIVLRAVGIGLEKCNTDKKGEALTYKKEAAAILDDIWARIQESMPQEVLKGTQRFNRIDVLRGTTGSKTDNNIGRF